MATNRTNTKKKLANPYNRIIASNKKRSNYGYMKQQRWVLKICWAEGARHTKVHAGWFDLQQILGKVKVFSSDRRQIARCLGPRVKQGKEAPRWAKDINPVHVKERFQGGGKTDRLVQSFSSSAQLPFGSDNSLLLWLLLLCVCVLGGGTVLCTEGCSALSGLYPQDAHGNLPQAPQLWPSKISHNIYKCPLGYKIVLSWEPVG